MLCRFYCAFAALVALVSHSCTTPLDRYECQTNADCADEGSSATCESAGVCSFGDSSCASGQRYGAAAGTLSHQCVAPQSADAAVADATTAAVADAAAADAPLDSADATFSAPPDANLTCTPLLSIVVTEIMSSGDEVRVRANGGGLGLCAGIASGGPPTMEECQFCMPPGAAMEVQAELAAKITEFSNTCTATCAGFGSCSFTASTSCAFAVEFTGP